jgi:hypothetical protein
MRLAAVASISAWFVTGTRACAFSRAARRETPTGGARELEANWAVVVQGARLVEAMALPTALYARRRKKSKEA